MKVLQVNTVTSDGRTADETPIPFHPLDPETGTPYFEDDGKTISVALTLRPITQEQHQKFIDQCTQHVAVKGIVQERIDHEEVRNLCVCHAVVTWQGFAGADGKLLPCSDVAKRHLDYTLKNAIVERAMRTQPIEVAAESFR